MPDIKNYQPILDLTGSFLFVKVGDIVKFEVNGNTWTIVYCNSSSDNLRRSDGSITLGVCDNSKKCIFLNNRLNNHMEDKVICHELTHVFSFEFNYVMDIETEEVVADFMSLFGRDIIYLADSIMNVLARRIA